MAAFPELEAKRISTTPAKGERKVKGKTVTTPKKKKEIAIIRGSLIFQEKILRKKKGKNKREIRQP